MKFRVERDAFADAVAFVARSLPSRAPVPVLGGVLLDAADETKPYRREVSRSLDAKAVEVLKKEGMTITDVSPEERTRMREKLKPVIEKHEKTINAALVEELNADIQKVRAAK